MATQTGKARKSKNKIQLANTTKGLIKLKVKNKQGATTKYDCLPGEVTDIQKSDWEVLKDFPTVEAKIEAKHLVIGTAAEKPAELPEGFEEDKK